MELPSKEINRLIDGLLSSVPLAIKKKGLDIYMQAHFFEPALSEDLFDVEVCVISSSGLDSYDVELNYDEELDDVVASCTCPYFETHLQDCKHIVAAAFQWKKLLGKSPVAALSTFRPISAPGIRNDVPGSKFTYRIASLDYWVLRNYQTYLQPKWVNDEELIVDDGKKSCALKCDGQLVSARFVDLQHLSVSCSCGELTQSKFCSHAATLLHGVAQHKGVYFFRLFYDYTNEIASVYKSYGLKPESELAKAFEFGIDNRGEFAVIKRPPNLLPLSAYSSWEKELSAIRPLSRKEQVLDTKAMPANIVAVGLLINLAGKNNLPYWIDGVIETENKHKKGYKKIVLNKMADLMPYSHLDESILGAVGELTSDSLVDHITSGTANAYVKTYVNPLNHLDHQSKSVVLGRFREVLSELLNAVDPDLRFYTILPGESFSNQNCQPVQLCNLTKALRFHLAQKDDFWVLSCQLEIGAQVLPLNDFLSYPPFLKYKEKMYLMEPRDEEMVRLFKDGDMMGHLQDTTAFVEKILKPLHARYPITFEPAHQAERVDEPVKARVYLSELNESFLMIRPKWQYGEFETEMDGASDGLFNVGPALFNVVRQPETEASFVQKLRDLHPRFKLQKGNDYFYLPFQEALAKNWFISFFADMQELNVQVFGVSDLKRFKYNANPPTIHTRATSGLDWFDLRIEVHYGTQIVGLAELKRAVLSKQEYVLLKDGSFGILPEEWIKKYSSLFKMGKVKDESLQISKFHYTLLDELHSQVDDETIRKELADKKQRLQQIGNFNEITLPSTVKASLRDYQLSGFKWMGQLEQVGWGGCLADDMGLGKTLQTLAFLQHRILRFPDETHLIVCPTSLLYNWETEIKKFTPELSYNIYYGSERIFRVEDFKASNLIISSYGLVRNDIAHIASFQFGYVILDESQNIKNPAAQVTKAVQLLKAKNRLILSGTPVQNNTFDLYAQMNFLNPGMLGNTEFFKTEFANPIDKYNEPAQRELLKKLIAPFVLRRTKEQVAKDLPDKTETVLWCEMDGSQRKVYDEFKNHYRETLMNRIEEDGMAKSSIYILEGLLKLRQICDSTTLLKDDRYKASSVKMNELLRELTENTGMHKALIFSQFTEMLALIRIELDIHGIKYAYLDGSTPAHKRKEAVDLFQNDDEQRVFLISLKAGGVGLNLTSADYVYLVDPWWNPAAEQQAIDRTHRIGQKNKIFAYKMICKDTVEEKILQLQEKKKALSGDLIADESGFVKKLSKEDVVFLFS
jgi:hypothetical protein